MKHKLYFYETSYSNTEQGTHTRTIHLRQDTATALPHPYWDDISDEHRAQIDARNAFYTAAGATHTLDYGTGALELELVFKRYSDQTWMEPALKVSNYWYELEASARLMRAVQRRITSSTPHVGRGSPPIIGGMRQAMRAPGNLIEALLAARVPQAHVIAYKHGLQEICLLRRGLTAPLQVAA